MVVPPDPLNFAEDPTRWLIVGTSFLAALSMGAVAFGPAIVFHVCVAVMSWVSGHPTDQATLIGLIMIAMTPPAVVQAVLTWRDVSWSMCTLLLSPAIITVPLGTLLLLALNPKPVARAVGVVVIIFALIRCFMEVRTLDLRWRAKKRQVAHPSEAKPLLRDDSSSNNHNRHEDNTVMVMASPSHKDGTLDTPPVVLTAASPGAADPPPKQPCCVWPTRGMFMLQGFTGACVGFFLGFMAIPGLPLMMLVAVVPLPKHIMRATITMTVTALHPVQVRASCTCVCVCVCVFLFVFCGACVMVWVASVRCICALCLCVVCCCRCCCGCVHGVACRSLAYRLTSTCLRG